MINSLKCPEELTTNVVIKTFSDKDALWHKKPAVKNKLSNSFSSHYSLIHYYNFQLWHEEDKARMVDVTDKLIAVTKRKIDNYNQLRNDSIEKLDACFLKQNNFKASITPPSLNSETAGAILDKISILSLKIFHMAVEARRRSAGTKHVQNCKQKLMILKIQQKDLADSLVGLICDFKSGKRYYKIYKQFKMYNDPSLNPLLYKKNEK